MYCMKCGKEIEETKVFCDACLSVMARKPVATDTAVQLPLRTGEAVRKSAPRKRQRSPEEQLRRLRGAVKWVSVALTCTVLALALTVSLLVHTVSAQGEEREIGKNYNTINTVGEAD